MKYRNFITLFCLVLSNSLVFSVENINCIPHVSYAIKKIDEPLIPLIDASICQSDSVNSHDGLTYWNCVIRTIDSIFVKAWSYDYKNMPCWWQRSRGFNTDERKNWLSKFEIKQSGESLFTHIKNHMPIPNCALSLIEYAKDPLLYAQNGNSYFSNYIFLGLPRIGKSRFVRALMQEVKQVNPAFRLFEMPWSELWTTMVLEESHEAFLARFQTFAPCMIFVKDIDSSRYDLRTYDDYKHVFDLLNNSSPSPLSPVIFLTTSSKLEFLGDLESNYINCLKREGKWHTTIGLLYTINE